MLRIRIYHVQTRDEPNPPTTTVFYPGDNERVAWVVG